MARTRCDHESDVRSGVNKEALTCFLTARRFRFPDVEAGKAGPVGASGAGVRVQYQWPLGFPSCVPGSCYVEVGVGGGSSGCLRQCGAIRGETCWSRSVLVGGPWTSTSAAPGAG